MTEIKSRPILVVKKPFCAIPAIERRDPQGFGHSCTFGHIKCQGCKRYRANSTLNTEEVEKVLREYAYPYHETLTPGDIRAAIAHGKLKFNGKLVVEANTK